MCVILGLSSPTFIFFPKKKRNAPRQVLNNKEPFISLFTFSVYAPFSPLINYLKEELDKGFIQPQVRVVFNEQYFTVEKRRTEKQRNLQNVPLVWRTQRLCHAKPHDALQVDPSCWRQHILREKAPTASTTPQQSPSCCQSR